MWKTLFDYFVRFLTSAGAIISAAFFLLGLVSWFIVRDVKLLFFYIAFSVFIFLFFLLIPFFQRMTQKIIMLFRRRWRVLVTLCLLLFSARLLIPCPIEGSWVGRMTGHLCEDHAFARFSDGNTTYFHGELKPENWGTYKKIGWNKYLVTLYHADRYPSIIHTGWFFSRVEDAPYHQRYWCHRDFHFWENRRIRNATQTNFEAPTLTKVRETIQTHEITR